MTRAPRTSRWVALTLVATLALPTLALTAGCGHGSDNNAGQSETNSGPMVSNSPMTPSGQTAGRPGAAPAKRGLSTKQKAVLLAGAALLFYLYKRDQANNAAAAAAQNGGSAMPAGHPQLYREDAPGPNKGAIYYRDANHKVVWLSAPAQGVQIPADQVQQYLPGYNTNPNAYQGQVNTSPQASNGSSVQSADQYANAYASQ